ncbi:hypothetical protein [Paenirhodobacter populi]|uniref:hypothetical protein n=1 Tax=Paenirhodobacter populi TaxID=2306993 RepID=UPI000FE41BDF|nr:hypothetical protein [Sinirhodobacter populi]RWR10182.1 hypothetical protein D2T32_03950 [Sinirhodobacter populi]
MRGLLLILALFCAVPAAADPRPEGLMWNRSGKPLTLPLQILSDPGEDLYVTLDAGQGPVLAAYIRGGAPFRLLVPPGRFAVAIAAGRDWQGEAGLFGPATRHVALPGALDFGVVGVGRRSGHLVDLRGGTVAVRDFGLCRGPDLSSPRAEAKPPRVAPPVRMPPEPKTLAEPRQVERRLSPPDQALPNQPLVPGVDPQTRPFARPFPEPSRIPIPRVAIPDRPAPPVRARPSAAQAGAHWTVCD